MPFPATTVKVPSDEIRVTTVTDKSATYRLPFESVATEIGPPNGAVIAGSGCRGNVNVVPAIVVMTCPHAHVQQRIWGRARRIDWLSKLWSV